MGEENKKVESANTQTTEKPKKKKKVGLIISIIFILLVVIAGGVFGVLYATVFAKTEVDLAKYVSFEFTGYEGYASVTEDDLIVDTKGLKKLLDDKSLVNKLQKKLLDKAEVSENEALENGDTITVKFKISEDWLKENKIKLTSDSIKVTVKDLQEQGSIDLFEDIELTYSGVSPDLTVTLNNNSSNDFIKYNVNFSMAKSTDKDNSSSYYLYDIANGDKIIVTAAYSETDLQNAGYAKPAKEKTYTVEGQAEYASKADDITSEVKSEIGKKLLEKAKNIASNSNYTVYSAYSEDYSDAGNYTYDFTHGDPELVKMYIAVNKDMEDLGWYDSRNIVYGIYKVKFTDKTTSKDYDLYVVAYVEDIVVDEDGLVTDRTYYYNEYYNSSYDTSDGKSFQRTSDETYKAIQSTTSDKYTLTEIK